MNDIQDRQIKKSEVLKVVACFAVWLSIDSLCREPLFEWSNTVTKRFKQRHDLDWFFKYGKYSVSGPQYVSVLVGSIVIMDY